MADQPLRSRTILITRSRPQASELRILLENLGAEVIEIPTIEIRPRPPKELDMCIRKLSHYDWLMFTSVNGARIFFERLEQTGGAQKLPKICVIGPATARTVEEYGFTPDLVPRVYQAEGILEHFLDWHDGRISGLKILLPRASRAREILPEGLRQHGAEVTVVPVYDTAIPEESRRQVNEVLEKNAPDLITFTSSSTVEHFLVLAEDHDPKRFHYAVIGPITAATARDYGLNVVVQADRSTIPDLVRAIERYFSS